MEGRVLLVSRQACQRPRCTSCLLSHFDQHAKFSSLQPVIASPAPQGRSNLLWNGNRPLQKAPNSTGDCSPALEGGASVSWSTGDCFNSFAVTRKPGDCHARPPGSLAMTVRATPDH